LATVALFAVVAIATGSTAARAQDEGSGAMGSANGMDSGGGMGSSNGMGDSAGSGSTSNDASMAPPMSKMHIRQPITGSMMAAPPYGLAPMRVGFFVLADDPEGLGFLTYSWNFGDGTVSALPPELYIFHTYKNPGTYACSLTITTVDGRSQTFRQGVVVKPPGD
jgi:PKD domain-containing protein